MQADAIIKLLAVKHSGDVFVPECKDGPSQGTSHFRLDAWAMARSWSNMRIWGYEIKSSRGDYQRDQKWSAYLSYCSEFYFVCPAKLILPEEVPDPAGLLWASSTGSRLLTKKRAAHRQVTIPESLYQYILMCRTRIKHHETVGDDDDGKSSRMTEIEKWVAQFERRKKLGYQVNRKIRERQNLLEVENVRLQSIIAGLEEFHAQCVAAGINPNNLSSSYARSAAMDKLLRGDLRQTVNSLRSARNTFDRLIREFGDENTTTASITDGLTEIDP